MEHEPSGLVGDADHPMQLVGAHALLARTEQVEGEQPLVQRDVRSLEDRSDRDRVLLAAGRALVQLAGSGLERVGLTLVLAAVRTLRTVRPADRLQVGRSGLRILEPLIQNAEGKIIHVAILSAIGGFVKYIIPSIHY